MTIDSATLISAALAIAVPIAGSLMKLAIEVSRLAEVVKGLSKSVEEERDERKEADSRLETRILRLEADQ